MPNRYSVNVNNSSLLLVLLRILLWRVGEGVSGTLSKRDPKPASFFSVLTSLGCDRPQKPTPPPHPSLRSGQGHTAGCSLAGLHPTPEVSSGVAQLRVPPAFPDQEIKIKEHSDQGTTLGLSLLVAIHTMPKSNLVQDIFPFAVCQLY